MIVGLSRGLTHMTELIEPLKKFSDSIYIKSVKHSPNGSTSTGLLDIFLKEHQLNPENNLNIVPLLSCPKTGKPVFISEDRTELICRDAGLAYPVKNEIPVMVASEARTV